MTARTLSAAVSHVGRIRANNQDSGYAGQHLFAVADGMGGHAGGDVASAIAIRRIREVDREFPTAHDAEFALQSRLIAANQLITETVFEHQELTGMGTTVSAMIRVGDQLAIAHIGDSRIYRWRDGELQQITSDHTFVQRLVDSGRITPEEAAVHPPRSVLMRVLGDVDAAPEVDTAVMDIRPGDRWLLCSDGLSSYWPRSASGTRSPRRWTPTRSHSGSSRRRSTTAPPTTSRSSCSTSPTPSRATTTTRRPPSGPQPHPSPSRRRPAASRSASPRSCCTRSRCRPPPRTRTSNPSPTSTSPSSSPRTAVSHPAPLLVVDRARGRRPRTRRGRVPRLPHRAGPLLRRHRPGLRRDLQGRPATIGPITLSDVYEDTDIAIAELPDYTRENVRSTINATSLDDARDIVDRLRTAAETGQDQSGTGGSGDGPSSTPSATPSSSSSPRSPSPSPSRSAR